MHKKLHRLTQNGYILRYIGIAEHVAIAEEVNPLAVVLPAPLRSPGERQNADPIEPDEPMSLETVKTVARRPQGANRYEVPRDSVGTTKIGSGKACNGERPLRGHPALYHGVKLERRSVNAAAEQAGFRNEDKRQTAFEQIVKWLPALTPEERHQLKELLA